MKKYKLLYILPAALLFACEPEFDDVDFNGGSADFSKTVAVGNSLSAGFQSNALSAEGQEYSLPNMIATQLKQVGGGAFTQPIIPGESGIKGVGFSDLVPANLVIPALGLRLVADCKGVVGPSPQLASSPFPNTEFFTPIGANGPYNNVGVPGARVTHLNFNGYANPAGLLTTPKSANPYFIRFASSTTETMLQAAMKSNPTFFELWIGNNDVLGYSTSGGDEGGDAITPSGTFSFLYKAALDSLTKNGAKGVVANIPYVTSIPYFTTVSWNALVLTQAQADGLNGAFASYNGALDNPLVAGQINDAAEVESRRLSFKAGSNGFLYLDTDLSDADTDTSGTKLPKYRQLKAGELITLPISQNDLKCNGLGSVNLTTGMPNPIMGDFVLEADEVAKIKTAVDEFNTIIKSEANARGLAFVDANARLQELATSGITIDGIAFTSAFVAGGAFSLDGVHPSTRGYAIIANDFIAAINAKYGANIPSVVVSSYPAIEVIP